MGVKQTNYRFAPGLPPGQCRARPRGASIRGWGLLLGSCFRTHQSKLTLLTIVSLGLLDRLVDTHQPPEVNPLGLERGFDDPKVFATVASWEICMGRVDEQ